MKRKIGEIYNKPIVEGDINLKGPNEIHKSQLSNERSNTQDDLYVTRGSNSYYKLTKCDEETMMILGELLSPLGMYEALCNVGETGRRESIIYKTLYYIPLIYMTKNSDWCMLYAFREKQQKCSLLTLIKDVIGEDPISFLNNLGVKQISKQEYEEIRKSYILNETEQNLYN